MVTFTHSNSPNYLHIYNIVVINECLDAQRTRNYFYIAMVILALVVGLGYFIYNTYPPPQDQF